MLCSEVLALQPSLTSTTLIKAELVHSALLALKGVHSVNGKADVECSSVFALQCTKSWVQEDRIIWRQKNSLMSLSEDQLNKFSCEELINHIIDPNVDDEDFDLCIEWFLFIYSPEQGTPANVHFLTPQAWKVVQENAQQLARPDLLKLVVTKMFSQFESEIFIEMVNVFSSLRMSCMHPLLTCSQKRVLHGRSWCSETSRAGNGQRRLFGQVTMTLYKLTNEPQIPNSGLQGVEWPCS